jgi:hypothetical protein
MNWGKNTRTNLTTLWEAHFSRAVSESAQIALNTILKYVCLKEVFNFAVRAHHDFFMHTIGKNGPISLLEAICAVSTR